MKINFDNDILIDLISIYKSRDLIEMNCSKCNNIFLKRKNKIQEAIRNNFLNLYCSKKCSNLDKQKRSIYKCLNCDNEVIRTNSEIKKNIFCSQSCSATYNNKGKNRHIKKYGNTKKREITSSICICGNKKGIYSLLCQKCRHKKMIEDSFNNIKNGNYNGTSNVMRRKYLSQRDGYRCSICSISDWQNKPLTLRVDHIDGNSDNNIEDNLRLVCHNCDSQLATYCNKNKGKGGNKAKQRLKSYYGKDN